MKLNLEQKVDLLLEKYTGQEVCLDEVAKKTSQIGALAEKVDLLLEKYTGQEVRLAKQGDVLDMVAIEVVNLRGDVTSLNERVGSLETKVEDGFSKLDEFVSELGRHDVEIVSNRSAINRHEVRLEAIENVA